MGKSQRSIHLPQSEQTGTRFGFVTLFDVVNVGCFKKVLDQIYTGNMKLNINLLRYRRSVEIGPKMEERKYRRYEKGEKKQKEAWKEKKWQKSFVEAVRGSSSQVVWKGPAMETQKQLMPWMENSAIGQLIPDIDFNKLCDEFVKGGMNMIKVRYMGDNLVLLTPREGDCIKDLIHLNKEWFESLFDVIDPWSESYLADHSYYLNWVSRGWRY